MKSLIIICMKVILIAGLSVLITGLIVMGVLAASNSSKNGFAKDHETGIQFHHGSWNKALELAWAENKLIFLDVYATWCGPCKRLKANTFSNEEVGAYYNPNFINVALDGENGEGLRLADKYGVSGYPTLLFIDHTGKVVAATSGYHNPEELIQLGKSVLEKLKQ